jgi:hypothetical protein
VLFRSRNAATMNALVFLKPCIQTSYGIDVVGGIYDTR